MRAACRESIPLPPPQKADISAPSPLPEQEGCSFNLNNCCQGFSGDSLVSETGSLVSRGLSGEHPPPPSPCCQGISTGGTFCTSFCSFLSPFCFPKHLSRVGRAPLCSAGADGVRVRRGVLSAPQKGSLLPQWLGSLVFVLWFNVDGGRGCFAGPPSISWVSLYRFATGMSSAS